MTQSASGETKYTPPDLNAIKKGLKRPSRVVVTAGMPYANGPVHIGHLAGAHVPADVYARYMRMLIGAQNVLYVCGTDDHGSTSEIAAKQAGLATKDFIAGIHAKQKETMASYSISLDTYTGTSRDECFPAHAKLAQNMLRQIYKNQMLDKRTSQQWFDPKISRFLQDRFVKGTCPNPKCADTSAYSDECEKCGATYDPSELIHPRSSLSDATPVLKDTVHWWLDMWKVSDLLRNWIQTKKDKWRQPVYLDVMNTVSPALKFDNTFEAKYKEIKATLVPHKSKYALGKKVQLQFETKAELTQTIAELKRHEIPCELVDGWAHRSISRDVSWGIPMPVDLDPEMKDKTLYVWPDSLIAPISFCRVALIQRGMSEEEADKELDRYWRDPSARVVQFLGQDNVYFYTLMQGAMWLGSQKDPHHLPQPGDLQMTDIFSVFHLQVDGEKMSKSRGNFYTADELLATKGYASDQIRYFLALLSLPEKGSNFDFNTLKERNRFLAGPLNAAFEKPVSACHSKFNGKVPEGKLLDKIEQETTKIVSRYVKSMEKAEYSTLLFAIENYARLINSMFTQHKPHDDRHDLQERKDALYSCFYVLKNLMIMLFPFAPTTMERLRVSLQLPASVFAIDELGIPIPGGHMIGQKQEYFPSVAEA